MPITGSGRWRFCVTIGSKKAISFFAGLFAISGRERGASRNLNAFTVEFGAVMFSTKWYNIPLIGAGILLDMRSYGGSFSAA